MQKQLFAFLTFLGMSLLGAVDAFWAAVAFITAASQPAGSRGLLAGAQQQPLAAFPNFAPAATRPATGPLRFNTLQRFNAPPLPAPPLHAPWNPLDTLRPVHRESIPLLPRL